MAPLLGALGLAHAAGSNVTVGEMQALAGPAGAVNGVQQDGIDWYPSFGVGVQYFF